jgi:hypothetical protein
VFNDGSAKPARLGALDCDELTTDGVKDNHWLGSRIRAPVSGVTAKVKVLAVLFVPIYSSRTRRHARRFEQAAFFEELPG